MQSEEEVVTVSVPQKKAEGSNPVVEEPTQRVPVTHTEETVTAVKSLLANTLVLWYLKNKAQYQQIESNFKLKDVPWFQTNHHIKIDDVVERAKDIRKELKFIFGREKALINKFRGELSATAAKNKQASLIFTSWVNWMKEEGEAEAYSFGLGPDGQSTGISPRYYNARMGF